MKLITISIFIALLINFNAFAGENTCPKLAAEYYCMFDYGGAGDLIISQHLNSDGVTVYEYNFEGTNYTYTADEVWREQGDSGSMIGQKEKFSCGQNTLIDDFIYHSSDLSTITTLQFIYKLDEALNLDGSYTENKRENDQDHFSSGKFLCQRMN
jgi:hypothetical protein